MTSWRDHTSEEAQKDIDHLLDVALELGEKALQEGGELRPFCVSVRLDGKTTVGMIDDDETCDAAELVERLVGRLRKERDRFRACAVVKDVTLRGLETEAVWVDLCHSEGAAITCYQPYERKGDTYRFGDLGAQAGQNLLW